MTRWHIVLHARAASVPSGPEAVIAHCTCPTLCPTPDQLAEPFPINFEQAYSRLERLPRMFIEPDGSFVWTGAAADSLPPGSEAAPPGGASPIDGILSDHAGRLTTVELKGALTAAMLDALLPAVGWPTMRVLIQLPREGIYLSEEEFRRRVSRD